MDKIKIDKDKFMEMSLKEIINYLTNTFHIPLKASFETRTSDIIRLSEEYKDKYPKVVHLKELYTQFKNEVLKHMKKEDDIMFPALLEYEEKNINLSKTIEGRTFDNEKMKSEHTVFQYYLNAIIELLEGCGIIEKDVELFEEVKHDFIKFNKDLKEHIYLEDEYVYSKWDEIQSLD